MPYPIDTQIEALEEAFEREITRCHLGASPWEVAEDEAQEGYDPFAPDRWGE